MFAPLLMNWQKGGEVFEFIYTCLYVYCLCIICFVYAKGGEVFGFAYVYILIYAYLCWEFIAYLYVYCYAQVKGELLWSLTLIHAYITPRVLSSSKRGRLLAHRPFTLVLMMINSCSYWLLIILWYLVSDIWSRY